ncbi:hypothetical protein AB0K09_33310 [Streptomyces sp. NPDC049577]|uniref:hypothetical protein n=1 Tax=Streptomyces sp. NPDC049577 TaxID=3155153 RepID=UPI003430A7B5
MALGRAAVLATAVIGARAAYGGVRTAWPRLGERRNRAGRTVQLCAGPAAAAGVLAGVGALPARARAAGAVAVLAAAGCGAYDDVAGAGDPRRGFRAHLEALRGGELTSGAVKLLGIGAAGLLAGAALKERPVDKVLAGIVIAGAAHAVNLLDVRPGRAAAAVIALGLGGTVRGAVAAAPVGAAAALLADDLAERTMLGDTGAHALGAGLGLAVVSTNGRAGLVLHAAACTAAAALAEARQRSSIPKAGESREVRAR